MGIGQGATDRTGYPFTGVGGALLVGAAAGEAGWAAFWASKPIRLSCISMPALSTAFA